MKPAVAAFPRTLVPFCICVVIGAAAFVSALVVIQGSPRPEWLVLFIALMVFGIHQGVVVPGKGLSFSPNVMVVMAAAVAFAHQGTTAGAVLVGCASGLFLPAFTRPTWGWVALNGATWGCAAGVAGLVLEACGGSPSSALPTLVLSLTAPAFAFVATSEAFIMLSFVVERGRSLKEVAGELTPHLVSQLPFAVVGLLVGRLFVSLGAAVMLLIIVPILIAREMFASYIRVKEAHDETVQMLIHALEKKDRYTSGHSERVATYARYMGEELNFMPARMERLRFAALMHDIGKLVVPNHILNKPGRLTEEEFQKIKLHEKVGVQMLSHIDFLRPIAPTTHGENMRFDPDDPDHPIEPYIIMIADAYDAMTSTRSYRKALSQEVAFQELRDKAGVQFHPECVEALIRAIEKLGEKHGAGFEERQEFDDAPDVGVGSAGLGDLLPSEPSTT